MSSHKICGCSDGCHCPYFAWLDLERWQCSGAKNWGCSGFLMPALHREGDAGPWGLEEDLTCLQVQGTRKILLLNCGRRESSRKIFSNFINTLKSFLRCIGLSEITYPLEVPLIPSLQTPHHTCLYYSITSQNTFRLGSDYSIQFPSIRNTHACCVSGSEQGPGYWARLRPQRTHSLSGCRHRNIPKTQFNKLHHRNKKLALWGH